MSASVKQYNISPSQPGSLPFWGKLGYFVSVLAITFFVQWVFDTFVPFFSHAKQRDAFNLLFLPFWMAVWFTFFPSKRETTVTIGEDFVERQICIGSYTLKKRITRAQTKSVSEVTLRQFPFGFPRKGLVVRDRGRVGSWLFGFVFIPATIPERDYEETKVKLMQWNLAPDQRVS